MLVLFVGTFLFILTGIAVNNYTSKYLENQK